MVNFGIKLKELRLQSGMTQKQLAQKLEVSTQLISYYELKKRYPSAEVLIKLSDIFHTSTDYLLGIEDRKLLDVSNLCKEKMQCLNQIIDMLKNTDD